MRLKRSRPYWWLLYLGLALTLGLGVVEEIIPLTRVEHQAAEVMLIFLIYAVVWQWLKANEAPLIWDEIEKRRKGFR